MTDSWCSLEEVVNAYLDRSEQGNSKFFKIWQISFDGMQQLGLNFFYVIRTKKIPVLANKTAPLPDDCHMYTKIGVLNSSGEMCGLKFNPKLATLSDLQDDRSAKVVDNTIFSLYNFNVPIFYNFWNGSAYEPIYGIPSGSNVGEFRIDKQMGSPGIIQLDLGYNYSYVLCEYVVVPGRDEQYYIPIEFKEALIWFLAWQDVGMLQPNRQRGTLGDVAQRKHNYFNERRVARDTYKPLRLMEAYDWSVDNNRKALKL